MYSTQPGPQGFAPASVRRFAPLSGLRYAPRARRCTPVWFFNFPTHREKKSRYQQKNPRYQANPRYQPKKRRYLYNSLGKYAVALITVCDLRLINKLRIVSPVVWIFSVNKDLQLALIQFGGSRRSPFWATTVNEACCSCLKVWGRRNPMKPVIVANRNKNSCRWSVLENILVKTYLGSRNAARPYFREGCIFHNPFRTCFRYGVWYSLEWEPSILYHHLTWVSLLRIVAAFLIDGLNTSEAIEIPV